MIDATRLRDVFDRAASLPPRDRAAFLARVCGEDEALLREVERLLSADAGRGSFLATASPMPSWDASSDSAAPRAPASPMLAPGARVGPYLIEAAIGAGGMGEVYRARDPRLDRAVAIKVLPSDRTTHPRARQRFEREARAAGSLTHPHICRLLDVGREGDVDYLVMELLEGESLEQRLARSRPTLTEALEWSAQIADALATAHGTGLVHRDLKPANVMLTARGAVLLDFGLAKRRAARALDRELEAPPGTLTQAGLIVGTVRYMSPEQLQGLPIDERADIFAFGAVLYEGITGRRAFDASSQAAAIGQVLHADPPAPSTFDPRVSPELDDLVIRCLQKDRAARWASMVDVRDALVRLLQRGPDPRRQQLPARKARARLLAAGVLLVVISSAAAAYVWRSGRPRERPGGLSSPPIESRLSRVTFEEGLQTDPAFSPDGKSLVYASDQAGNFDIYVRSLASVVSTRITANPAHELEPRWSPDGRTIAFRSERDGGGLYVVPAGGGPERRIANANATFEWSTDGRELRFLESPSRADDTWHLRAVSVAGDASRDLYPEFLKLGRWGSFGFHPDGRLSLYGVHATLGLGFFTRNPDGGVVKSPVAQMPEALNDMVHNGLPRFAWTRDGTSLILETADNVMVHNLWRVHVDPATLAWTSFDRLTAGAGADVAANLSPDESRIAFSVQQWSDRVWRLPFDPTGRRLLAGAAITNVNDDGGSFDVTGDDAMALFTLIRRGTYAVDIATLDIGTRNTTVVVKDAMLARLSPDGRRAAFIKIRGETTDPANGDVDTTVMLRDMVAGEERAAIPWRRPKWAAPCAWSRDSRSLFFFDGDHAIREVPVGEGLVPGEPRLVLAGADDAHPSPDGRFLVYMLAADGTGEPSTIAITGAEGPPGRGPIAIVDKGTPVGAPRWSPDGRHVYYLRKTDQSYFNVWGAEVDPRTGHVLAGPYQMTRYASRTQHIAPGWSWLDTAVTAKHFYVPVHTESGAIWLLGNIPR